MLSSLVAVDLRILPGYVPCLFIVLAYLLNIVCLLVTDFKAEAISGDTKVLNESGKEIPLPKK
jgi:hypothetical protein